MPLQVLGLVFTVPMPPPPLDFAGGEVGTERNASLVVTFPTVASQAVTFHLESQASTYPKLLHKLSLPCHFNFTGHLTALLFRLIINSCMDISRPSLEWMRPSLYSLFRARPLAILPPRVCCETCFNFISSIWLNIGVRKNEQQLYWEFQFTWNCLK